MTSAVLDVEDSVDAPDRLQGATSTAGEPTNAYAFGADAPADLVAALETWMRPERAKLSRHAEVAKAIDYMLTRWPAFARFLEDGRICLTNNAAERALRGLTLGRK
jgi:Transposase IS66 family